MSFLSNSPDRNRNLAIEQEKPLGLFAGLFEGISKAFEEHKQNLQERVMARRERIRGAAEEKQELAAETPKPFLLAMLDKWLFGEEKDVPKMPPAPEREKELVHIGADKTALIDNPAALAQQRDPSFLELTNNSLKPTPTPSVHSSQSADVGWSRSLPSAHA